MNKKKEELEQIQRIQNDFELIATPEMEDIIAQVEMVATFEQKEEFEVKYFKDVIKSFFVLIDKKGYKLIQK